MRQTIRLGAQLGRMIALLAKKENVTEYAVTKRLIELGVEHLKAGHSLYEITPSPAVNVPEGNVEVITELYEMTRQVLAVSVENLVLEKMLANQTKPALVTKAREQAEIAFKKLAVEKL